MTKKQLLEAIETEAKTYFEDASGCHDWSHVERVRALALRICEAEGADSFVVEASALLHDIAKNDEMRCKGEGGFCHAVEGGVRARPILEGLGVDEDTIERIVHCVTAHRKRNEHVPESLEAKIIFDADKLDSLGAIGIGRAFLFAGMFAKRLYSGKEAEQIAAGKDLGYTEDDTALLEYEMHLKPIKDKMLTETGRQFAEERLAFMEDFFDRFRTEIDGRK
jgi:uncharacterized protein